MATLYVENVPDDLYQALRDQARRNRRSIAAETLNLLENNLVTPAELKRREAFYRQILKLRSRKPASPGPFPSTEEMLRQDRAR